MEQKNRIVTRLKIRLVSNGRVITRAGVSPERWEDTTFYNAERNLLKRIRSNFTQPARRSDVLRFYIKSVKECDTLVGTM